MHIRNVFLVLVLAFALGACSSSNAEKIEAFCTDFNAAVQENKEDCGAMAEAITEVSGKHGEVMVYGSTSDEESKKAISTCEDAGNVIAKHCPGDPNVSAALEALDN